MNKVSCFFVFVRVYRRVRDSKDSLVWKKKFPSFQPTHTWINRLKRKMQWKKSVLGFENRSKHGMNVGKHSHKMVPDHLQVERQQDRYDCKDACDTNGAHYSCRRPVVSRRDELSFESAIHKYFFQCTFIIIWTISDTITI